MFVWSPVLAPDTVVAPVTARVGVDEPERTTALTEVGVIAPSETVIAGVEVGLATDPDTPAAVVTLTLVTEPAELVIAHVESPRRKVVASAVPEPSRAGAIVPDVMSPVA
jgi:hypothetical protein